MLRRLVPSVVVVAALTGFIGIVATAASAADAPKTDAKAAPKADAKADAKAPAKADAKPAPGAIAGLELPIPADNPQTPGKIKLGEQLFHDKRLSKAKAMSCETCHLHDKGWTDGLAFSKKHDGTVNVRHTPTLLGAAFAKDLYWDGRAAGLEAQITAAWKGQMGADPDAIATELAAIPAYKSAFEAELGGPPTADRVAKALASYVRTLQGGDTAWDKMDDKAKEKSAAGRGYKVFTEVAHCNVCHLPPLFSDTLFHNVGVGMDKEKPDLGRGKILADATAKAGKPANPADEALNGAFKTPSLRGVAQSGPYFHDGRAATLEEAVDLMAKGGIANPHLDPLLKPVTLTAEQKADLVAFLKSLTNDAKVTAPKLP